MNQFGPYGNPYPQQPQPIGYFNPMAAGGQPAYWNQTPQPPAPQPQMAPQPATPSQLEQQFNAWAESHGVDLSKFNNDAGSFLDAMYEAAQAGFDAQDKQNAPPPASAAPDEPVDVRYVLSQMEKDDRGQLVPRANANLTYKQVETARELARKHEQFQYDPDGFLKSLAEPLVEERAREIARKEIEAFRNEMSQETSFKSFVDEHSEWLYVDGDKQNGLTEYGKQFVNAAQELESAGVSSDKVLEIAWQQFQGPVLRDYIKQQYQQAQVQQQQFNPTAVGADGMYRPQQDVQQQAPQQQPRNPNGTFASPQAQPAPAGGQMPQNWQQPAHQPFQNGTQQNTGVAPTPAAEQQQQSPQQAATPPQQTFLQEHGFVGAGLEPEQRSDSFASGFGSEGFDLTDLETIQTELATRAGIDMSVN